MKRVILESPYAGDIKENVTYARACVRDSVLRGEAPIASHLLFTQDGILDDSNQRALGIAAGLAWLSVADKMVIYRDRGISDGMRSAILAARKIGIPIEYREIWRGPLGKGVVVSFFEQMKYEEEGGAAGLSGMTRDNCPYDKMTQPLAWNHWVFGCEIAQSEMEIVKTGELFFSSTSWANPCIPGTGYPVKEAVQNGVWKPRFVKFTTTASSS